jgi:hypothetical protein
MFRHRNIRKFTCTLLRGKTHNRIDHILIDRRRYSSVAHTRSFWGMDWDTDHYPNILNVRKRVAVSKYAAQKY